MSTTTSLSSLSTSSLATCDGKCLGLGGILIRSICGMQSWQACLLLRLQSVPCLCIFPRRCSSESGCQKQSRCLLSGFVIGYLRQAPKPLLRACPSLRWLSARSRDRDVEVIYSESGSSTHISCGFKGRSPLRSEEHWVNSCKRATYQKLCGSATFAQSR